MSAIDGTVSGRFFRYCWVLLFTVLAGCGGGDGENNGGNSDPSSPQPRQDKMVGGIVSAPNAAVAVRSGLSTTQRSTRLYSAPAQAALDGAVPVPDGTLVELARIDSSGNILEVLTSTRTSAGRYSFDFEKLGLEFSSDLMVRAVNEDTSLHLRASVIYGAVDIDPITEATFRLFSII